MLWSNQTYFSKEFNIANSGRRRRVVLPDPRYEMQRQKFWYRTEFRINVVQRALDFFNPKNLKNKFIEYMWSFLNRHWTENNPCTWILFFYVQAVVPTLDCKRGV